MEPTDHEHYSEQARMGCYQCSLEADAAELAVITTFVDHIFGEHERSVVDRLQQFIAQGGSLALARQHDAEDLKASLRVLAGFARFFVEASDVRGGDIKIFFDARHDLKNAVEAVLDDNGELRAPDTGLAARMQYQAGLIDGQKRMEHFMHACTELNEILADGMDISADDLGYKVTALKAHADHVLYTRDVFAALAAEYKHALEHVATCGGTCHDCQRLARSALGHENQSDFLGHVQEVNGLKDHFLPMLKALVAELEDEL